MTSAKWEPFCLSLNLLTILMPPIHRHGKAVPQICYATGKYFNTSNGKAVMAMAFPFQHYHVMIWNDPVLHRYVWHLFL